MFGLKRNESKTANEGRGNSNGHLIDLRQVVKTFESTAGIFTALKGIDLKVGDGEFLSIVGKSGSGKSTLINMVTGIDRPTSGQVMVGDTAVHRLNEEQIAVWRGHTIGVIFQFFQLLPTLTAVENIMLPMDYGELYVPSERPERAMYLLEQIGMALMINFVLPPTSSLMPLLVTEHFGGDALQLGCINSALGVGVLAGGLILGAWGGFKRRILTTLVSLWGMGLSYLVIGFAPATLFSLALFAAFLAGAMVSFVNGPVFAIFQATIEPAMQGRVFTLVGSLGGAMAPVGLIVAGPIADIFGIQIWYIVSGGVVALMGIAGYFIPAVLNIESNNGKAAEALEISAERISAEIASS